MFSASLSEQNRPNTTPSPSNSPPENNYNSPRPPAYSPLTSPTRPSPSSPGTSNSHSTTSTATTQLLFDSNIFRNILNNVPPTSGRLHTMASAFESDRD